MTCSRTTARKVSTSKSVQTWALCGVQAVSKSGNGLSKWSLAFPSRLGNCLSTTECPSFYTRGKLYLSWCERSACELTSCRESCVYLTLSAAACWDGEIRHVYDHDLLGWSVVTCYLSMSIFSGSCVALRISQADHNQIHSSNPSASAIGLVMSKLAWRAPPFHFRMNTSLDWSAWLATPSRQPGICSYSYTEYIQLFSPDFVSLGTMPSGTDVWPLQCNPFYGPACN